jgi:polyphosphate kinase
MKARAAQPNPLFFGRDESWMDFNQRVLGEAQNEANPLLERVKYLAITASNLDEFVEIRVAGILQRIEDGDNQPGVDGLTPGETLHNLSNRMHQFVNAQYACWNQQILPELARHRVRVLGWQELDESAREQASEYYQTQVDPLLTPVTIDPSHPFPRVLNKALCLALLLKRKRKGPGGQALGVVTVPRAVPRLVRLKSAPDSHHFIQLHDLIEAHAAGMFRGYEILSRSAFRVTRNSNLYLQEEESRSVLESVRAELHNRRKGDAVRLEIESSSDAEVIERLRTTFELDEWQVFRTDGPVNLNRLMNLYTEVQRSDMKFPAFTPKELKLSRSSADLFEELRQHDILLHHPYDSYDPVVSFVEAAAEDDEVISIKQTLYRTSNDSPIFRALTEAAQSKEVTLVVELMARFDEASNIRWARSLEDAGGQVFHGVMGLKTHCKMSLLVRRDPDGVVRRYAHLGTGNYNPVTSRFYTDISLLTSDAEITAGMHAVFNYLTAQSESDNYGPLLVAPLNLFENFIRLIERETAHARAGRPARIIAKMNSLLDSRIIEALYKASQAGVEVDLIVRGICTLRPGMQGLSERIRVRSVVGRYLEHSRIFWFENGGETEVYCGSADWMPRNLFERCEVVFPVRDPAYKLRLREEVLAAYLADTAKTHFLREDGVYVVAEKPGMKSFNAQKFLMLLAEEKATAEEIPAPYVPPVAATGAAKAIRAVNKSVASRAKKATG